MPRCALPAAGMITLVMGKLQLKVCEHQWEDRAVPSTSTVVCVTARPEWCGRHKPPKSHS